MSMVISRHTSSVPHISEGKVTWRTQVGQDRKQIVNQCTAVPHTRSEEAGGLSSSRSWQGTLQLTKWQWRTDTQHTHTGRHIHVLPYNHLTPQLQLPGLNVYSGATRNRLPLSWSHFNWVSDVLLRMVTIVITMDGDHSENIQFSTVGCGTQSHSPKEFQFPLKKRWQFLKKALTDTLVNRDIYPSCTRIKWKNKWKTRQKRKRERERERERENMYSYIGEHTLNCILLKQDV